MASDNEETQSQSGSVAFNHDQIPTLYINPDDFEGDDDDELSVWTVDTQETDLSKAMGYSTTSNLPTAIECGVNRSHIFSRPKEKLKPFELSTVSNAYLLEMMSDGDLIQSIIEIWVRTQLHVSVTRLSNLSWYNWVLLDISRRVFEIYKRENADRLLISLIESLAGRVYYQPISSSLVQDGRPFVHYPLFNSEKITRLIKLGAKFTDTICAASEFIDFMYVLNMTKEEFVAFYDQMFQSKHILNERFKVIRGPYHSTNPLGPFKPTRFH